MLLTCGFLMRHELPAQWKGGAEQYFSFSSPVAVYPTVLVSLQSGTGFYTEMRYQYDMDRSFSVNAGKLFVKKGVLLLQSRPTLGIITGKYEGFNLNFDNEASWKNWFTMLKTQYSFSFDKSFSSFFYAWYETGYELSENFYAGVSLQVLAPAGSAAVVNKGFFAGIGFGSWSFPVYFFDLFTQRSSMLLGVVYQIQLKK